MRPLLILIQAGVLCKWTVDSKRLILESFDMIHKSPSYTYHSAIPFSPSSSWLHQSYPAELLQEVKVLIGLPVEWGLCSCTVIVSGYPLALANWKDTITVGLRSCDIVLLDTITGSQVAILSGHTNWVRSLAFSPDGMLLVSGSDDRTVSLWDVQTGGAVKTFHGHTNWVCSVSVSAESTTIASGSYDRTIRLWDIKIGECYCVIQQEDIVTSVNFSPKDPQYFISVSGGSIQQWGINGQQIGPTYDGSHVAFSLDGTQLVSCQGTAITIQNTGSDTIVTKFLGVTGECQYCCFSPDGKSVAIAAYCNIYIWDITSLSPCLINTFVGHTKTVFSIAFSSSLISASYDQSVKFWKVGSSSADPATTNPTSIPSTPAPITSITLQARDGIAISTDSNGVVKTWDILTGFCEASFKTSAKGPIQGDAQLINNRLISVWWADNKIHVWDVEKGELLQTVDAPGQNVKGVRISGDGSKVFCLDEGSGTIQAWSMLTGGVVGAVQYGFGRGYSLTVDGSRVWAQLPGVLLKGWDFGVPGSSPVELSSAPLSKPHLGYIVGAKQKSFRIKDIVTGKEVFCPPGRFAEPIDSYWDGKYLVAGYDSGEVLILDFGFVLPSRDL